MLRDKKHVLDALAQRALRVLALKMSADPDNVALNYTVFDERLLAVSKLVVYVIPCTC